MPAWCITLREASRHYCLLAFLLSGTFLFAQRQTDFSDSGIPMTPAARLNDLAGVLNADERRSLEERLLNLESSTSTQIFVLIANSIPQGWSLEDASLRIFENWRPGREKEDNGLLIAVFMQDRKMRIETGYGLEGALTDLEAGRVVDYIMAPAFKNGNFYGGISQAVDAIIGDVQGEYQIPTSPPLPAPGFGDFLPLLFLLFFIWMMWRARRNAATTYTRGGYKRHSWGGPIIWGGGFGNRGSGGGFGGGGFGGGFGGMSGGGGASGGW